MPENYKLMMDYEYQEKKEIYYRVGIHSCLFADFSMDLRKRYSQSCIYIKFTC
jgi:hypothetical protein